MVFSSSTLSVWVILVSLVSCLCLIGMLLCRCCCACLYLSLLGSLIEVVLGASGVFWICAISLFMWVVKLFSGVKRVMLIAISRWLMFWCLGLK